MLHIVLFEPEIPPNTGNIIRLCANTGARLHLIAPLGFELDAPRLRRAGLDYHELASTTLHDSWEAFLKARHGRVVAFTTRAADSYARFRFRPGDALLFGPESRGLPGRILEQVPRDRRLRLPMRPGSRSLNLSNAAAVACYEAWRQLGFPDGM